MSLLLGIDVGTSSVKSVLYDPERGSAVGDASREHDLSLPVPNGVEQDAEAWWQGVCETLGDLFHETDADPRAVAGIGVGGQGWSCLPVDEQGRPLRPAMIWLDRRAEEECRWLEENVGHDRVLSTAGNRIDPAYVTPKMLWLRKHEPAVARDARCWLTSEGYILRRLTGECALSLSSGYGHYFFTMATGEYTADMAEDVFVDLDTMPPIRRAVDVAGEVTVSAAKATGLTAGTPVVVGGLDAACAALGAGVVDVGQTQDQGGSAAGMSICVDRPLSHRDLILGWHVAPDLWLLQGGTVGGGSSMKWFREIFGVNAELAAECPGAGEYELLSREAELAEAGSGGVIFLPYLSGERSPIWDTRARGAFLGLTFGTKRPQLVRAVMEGTAFALRHNLETAREAGADVDILHAVGGAAASDVWCRIKADVTGKAVRVPVVSEGTPLGAAICAGVGMGVFADVKEGVERMVRLDRCFDPEPRAHARYQELFEIYSGLYTRLKDSMHALSGFTESRGQTA